MVKKDIVGKKREAYAKASKAKGKGKIGKEHNKLKSMLKRVNKLSENWAKIKEKKERIDNALHVYFGGVCDSKDWHRKMTEDEKKELRMLNPDLDTMETPTYESLINTHPIIGMFVKRRGNDNVIIHDFRGKVYSKPTYDNTLFYKTMKK